MPTIRVFDFANAVKDYVRNVLKRTSWSVQTILAVYSTRVKSTQFGYKVIPLEAGVIAYDSESKSPKNCRIKFDAICEMFGCGSHSFPYLYVSDNPKHTRNIYEGAFTYLSIDCRKEESFNGNKFYKHNTVQTNSSRFEQLNEDVLATIKERLEAYNRMSKKQYVHALNELLYDNFDEMQPEDYDYDDNISISCDVGGYKK